MIMCSLASKNEQRRTHYVCRGRGRVERDGVRRANGQARKQSLCKHDYQTRAGQMPSKVHAGVSFMGVLGQWDWNIIALYLIEIKILRALSHRKLLALMAQSSIMAPLGPFSKCPGLCKRHFLASRTSEEMPRFG